MVENKKELNKGCTFKINIDATQVKQELNEIEAQLDRIIEKIKIVKENDVQEIKNESRDNYERPFTEYEKTIMDNLNNKYFLKPCDIWVKELKYDLINLYKDDKFLWGYDGKIDFMNDMFRSFVTDPSLYEKEKLTLEDLKENE